MNDFLSKLPTWFLIALFLYLASLISYAVFDNRRVDLWPPTIYGKDNGCPSLEKVLESPNLRVVAWLFKRDDDTIISPKVQLMEGGKITGIKSANETTWAVIDGKLVFFDGEVRRTTEFDKVDCAVVLSGNYLLSKKGDRPVRHKLIGQWMGK